MIELKSVWRWAGVAGSGIVCCSARARYGELGIGLAFLSAL